MLIIDFMSFLSVLIFVWVYLVSALYPTSNIKLLFKLDSQETKTKDFLESEVFLRNTIIQVCSYFFLSIMFLLMCIWDERQKAIDMQYFTLIFELVMLFSMYFGNTFLKLFAVVSYVLRIIIVIAWGCLLMYLYDSHIGPKIGRSPN
jgi:magnesium-transporting ATPase (P-type)